ncbi:MAG: histidinol dehydrogenase [Candidatus Amulumruptor caecigallinarius]|nr:histidinol dehydrogenase [Candidatus Amulumruptor caecigallinarius]MCM1396675.1 histidinol dehydrogenase [Candidatus Amulumruptor caecigallinarius]MCM1453267.1 histidinol dehydrogenase [bacterium]
MDIVINPAPSQWRSLTERNIPDDPQVQQAVDTIIDAVRADGDKALRELALKFDGTHISDLEVTKAEIDAAEAAVSDDVKIAIGRSVANITAFHAAQMPQQVEVNTMPGITCIQRAVPIQRVGLYIPGGRAPLFSTVLMLAVPARIAGCPEVILCTPQGADRPISPEILYAARVCGIKRIFRVGGAQAIAAMALGTDSIPRVHKIFGPGNRFVTKAKQILTSEVAIDMPAGPSEVLVMADHTANPAFVASDMLSQAEHGPDSQAICVCTTEAIASAVAQALDKVKATLKRIESIEKSLAHSRIIVLPEIGRMTEFVNSYAPEHLIISMERPWDVAAHITAAGSVFIGNHSPESAGDYASGTNHTLPTNGWAHAYSGVNIDSFMRKITYQELTPEGLGNLADTVITMADAEGLDAHAMAVKLRTGRASID